MIVYIGVFFLLVTLGLVDVFFDKKKIVFASGSVLGLMAGLRYYTGYDFTSYQEYFFKANSFRQLFDGSIRLEPGYLFFVVLFRSLGFNYYSFVLIFSLITLAGLTYFLYKYVRYPSLAILYYYARYFLARDMGQVRASLVAVILLFAIPYVLKRQPLKFLGIIVIGAMFHYSALLFIPVYILNMIIQELTLKKTLLLGFSALFMGIVIQNPSLFIDFVPEGYRNYFTSPSHTSGHWLMYPILWMQCLIFGGVLFFNQYNQSMDKKWYNLIATIYLLAILALVAMGRLETVGGRISTLFATVEILLVPFIFNKLSRYHLFNIIAFIGFTFIVFILIFILSGMYRQYIPYDTIF
ncbi:EpsG family protein [Marinilactibacillus psychrotolerans]|uniref:EpsG family protein n=1 Tax=Marinilactibacillus psychrotolerans TaxID=191770 RepID=A0A5R9C0R2_9LACT|nr:EpsG family protein [Marinilactibacillus psychrotolerans]TLQ06266.1 EpsG family protein [Marinilactibacillus psychrotolerans]